MYEREPGAEHPTSPQRALMQGKPLRWRPLWSALGWVIVAAILWLSLRNNPFAVEVQNSDKFEHALAYCVLMFWFGQLHPEWLRQAAYAAAWIGLGIAIEFVQREIGRDFELLDMVADAIGVLIGWGLARSPAARLLPELESALLRAFRGDR